MTNVTALVRCLSPPSVLQFGGGGEGIGPFHNRKGPDMATTQTRGQVLLSHRVAIQTRYYGPTNTRGTRIGVTHNGGKRIYVPWDYALNSEENHAQAVAAYLDRMGWDGRWMTGASADSTGYVAVWVGA